MFSNSRLLLLLVLLQSCTNAKKSASLLNISEPVYYSIEDFNSVKKFDTHIHLNTSETAYIEQAAADNLRFLDIVDDRPFGITMQEQEKIAVQQINAFPDRISYAATFTVKGWDDENWQQQAITHIKNEMQKGAVAVKVWKNVGMELKDKNGNFVMIDNPRFDPILDYLAKNNIPLLGHLGEPKDCWLPLDKMVLHKGYYSQHPEYHMYLHPEYPSYESHIKAKDHMLEKHPDLHFIGAHLGSLEWNLEELTKRLDKFPNMAVDLSRMPELFLFSKTDWQKTRDFFIKYQDRLLYATDVQVVETKDIALMKKRSHDSRVRYWTFFVSNERDSEFKGLHLPREVVDKIYRTNAEKWIPGTAKNNN
ncbi:MAG: amidohydrolase family protein [Chitinophagaceae bacterium]